MKLLVLGNALLDMVVSVGPEFLQSYGLIPDSSQTVAENESLKALLAEVSKMDKVVIKPGGSALNTVRMTQHLLKNLKVSSVEIVMLGSVGNDRSGQLLIQTVKDEGIQFVAQTVENVATGRCACLLTHGGTARTMVTDLGASLNFEYQIWKNMSGSRQLLEETHFLYISGYFLKVSPQTVMDTVNAVKRKSVPIILNLNAVWVSSVCKEGLEQILPDVNILFGNEQEIRSFAKELSPQLSNFDSMTAAEIVSLLAKKLNQSSTVIMTRGALPVIFANNGETKEYDVPKIIQNIIVDSTGAGDAFVGGFLAAFVQKMPLDQCLFYATWAASEELKGYGFILPTGIPPHFLE